MRRYELEVNGKAFTITVREFSGDHAELEIDGERYAVRVDDVVSDGPKTSPVQPTKSLAAAGEKAAAAGAAHAPAVGPGGLTGAVLAPIPGQILEILVSEGDEVQAGKPLLVMEAMKMENVINAPTAGTVGPIMVRTGDAVTQGQELLVIA